MVVKPTSRDRAGADTAPARPGSVGLVESSVGAAGVGLPSVGLPSVVCCRSPLGPALVLCNQPLGFRCSFIVHVYAALDSRGQGL